jgi:hypothetical protein
VTAIVLRKNQLALAMPRSWGVPASFRNRTMFGANGSLEKAALTKGRITSVIFIVHFLRDASDGSRPHIIRSVEFEADDLCSVVSRTRIILASTDYEAGVDMFQIFVDGTQVLYQERRGSVDQCGLDATAKRRDVPTMTITTSPS